MYFFFLSALNKRWLLSSRLHSLAGCSGLGDILKSLEGRGQPTHKPMAIKRKAVKQLAKPDAKAAAAKAAAKPATKAAAAKAAAAGKEAAAAPPADPAAAAKLLTDTRKCVHSRAYKAAAKLARDQGLEKAEISKAACLATKEAAEKWDLEHV